MLEFIILHIFEVIPVKTGIQSIFAFSFRSKAFLLSMFLVLFGFSLFPQEFPDGGETKPLLRVFPIFRPEECEGSIRFDICLRCMKKRERYAQRILFMKDGGPYREHGCFTDVKGFYVLR